MKWRQIYQCPCGQQIPGIGTGEWASRFFLDGVCSECGTSKVKFKDLGVGYWNWKPTLLDWFAGEYVFRKP